MGMPMNGTDRHPSVESDGAMAVWYDASAVGRSTSVDDGGVRRHATEQMMYDDVVNMVLGLGWWNAEAKGEVVTIEADEQLWRSYRAACGELGRARAALMTNAVDLHAIIGAAIGSIADRACALSLILSLPPGDGRPHLPQLIALASAGETDMQLVRDVVVRLKSVVPLDEIQQLVEPILLLGGEEEFLRIAELYERLDGTLLAAHLQRCAAHPDVGIRDVVGNFPGVPF